jgi:membrane protease YdiL (CAAX protease family)
VHGLGDVARGVGLVWLVGLVIVILGRVASSEGMDDKSSLLLLAPVDGVIMLAACWLFACRKYGRSLAAGLGLARVRPRVMAVAAFVGLAWAGVATLVHDLAGAKQTWMGDAVEALGQRPAGGLLLLVIVALVGAAEEIYYRGFIFPAFAGPWGARRAVVLVSAWFALIHVPQLFGDWIGVGLVAVMAFVLTSLRARTGSTLPGIVAHVAYNVTLAAPYTYEWIAKLLP